ncbi:hypothetical protein F442_22291 [Phytophthora nicotianae P10297]|uniref:Uncharacterized protein n=1 Tax=Phytophthora nicotianae P10297 TaxID=1317064 RepID=W2XZY3_PHYNI|nr:hypothetical protein F442_22291 [Phytophthora nicotianae P10297]
MNDDGKDGVVLILMLALAHEGPQEKDERQRGQNYLTRADLHPEARYGTTWEAIYGAGLIKNSMGEYGPSLKRTRSLCSPSSCSTLASVWL